MNSSPQRTETSPRTALLVFTDLDGTLLNDHYTWAEAQPALDHLRALGFPVVLSSSKTLDEMVDLAKVLDTGAPLIAENGALLAIPDTGVLGAQALDGIRKHGYRVAFTGMERTRIVAVAHELRARAGYRFSGFHDWSIDEIIAATGLSRDQAVQAGNRLATEPILWEDDAHRWDGFEAALRAEGIGTVKGGRFIHLMGNTDKAEGLKRVVELYKELEPDTEWHVVALGDSPNDLAMLSAADTAVVIPNPRHPAGLAPAASRVLRAEASGPLGWNTCMNQILEPYFNMN